MPRRNRRRRTIGGKPLLDAPRPPAKRIARRPRHAAHGCPTGKTRFPDHGAATLALKAGRNHSTRDVIPVRAYECPRCGGGWHLTSQATPGAR